MKRSIGAKTFLPVTPVLIVGSYNDKFQPNLMACAWGGICCSKPPCVNVSLRKATYSYHNIDSRKAFTVNILFGDQVEKVDFYGIVSGRDHNKFEQTSITPVKSDIVDAPYGKEFPMVLECKVIHQIEIGLHTEFIGEIMDIKIENDLLDENGKILVNKFHPILYIPEIREYYTRGEYLGKAHSMGKNVISSQEMN
jgi:flavin reductase (DIM6/NTAB) family NADH-FMN oxidoreductase RutF